MRWRTAAFVLILAAFAPAGEVRAADENCTRLDAYRVVIERSSLTSMKKREALLRHSQTIEQREKLRPRRSVAGLDSWCKESLADLRRRDGL